MTKAADIIEALCLMENEAQRKVLCSFFKTGPGQYGEGDMFLGLKVPQTRSVVKEVGRHVDLPEIERLLYSQWHEARLCGLLLLVEEMKAALPARKRLEPEDVLLRKALRRQELAGFYLRHARRANNWDLVDLSCPHVLGCFLLHPLPDGTMPSRDMLDRLAASDNLWEQRIGIVATLELIRHGQLADTLRLAEKLLPHSHDLIRKATGWMLREVGKRDIRCLLDFLDKHYARMSRTTLGYAIERLPEPDRQYWLKRDRK